jgi:hypothetical protein
MPEPDPERLALIEQQQAALQSARDTLMVARMYAEKLISPEHPELPHPISQAITRLMQVCDSGLETYRETAARLVGELPF